MDPAVSLQNLTVTLGGATVLDAVTTTLAAGKITGLLGPSGAGKTTLMRVMMGLQRPSAGSATIFGLPAGHRQLRRTIGYVTQSLSIYYDLSVHENLHYFAAMVGANHTQVKRVVQDVDLEPFTNQLVRHLSGGQRSRVSLAAALLGKPRLLVLDEPTVGLDPVLREELWSQFHQLADDGTTLLISSHVMEEAERCDHLLLLREGRVLAQGTPDGLKRKTHTDSVEQTFLHLVRSA